MKYLYEDMSPEQFEDLIVFLCQHLLGISVQRFSTGPDGGRDAKFVGTAELHPSKAAPWVGTIVIQAKHTNGYNKYFNESDFFSGKAGASTAILGKEALRLKRLVDEKKIDHYMLFSNRRLSGEAESEITDFLSNKSGLAQASIYLCGVEQLEIFFKQFPDVPKRAELDPVDSPLIISPDELAELVETLAKNLTSAAKMLSPPVSRSSYEDKNQKNNMSGSYAKELRKRYLKETAQIHDFLSHPLNIDLQRRYSAVVEEFQFEIIAKRKNHQTFDEVLQYLAKLLFDRDAVLRRNKRLTRAVLFYMYWMCDIGENNGAATK